MLVVLHDAAIKLEKRKILRQKILEKRKFFALFFLEKREPLFAVCHRRLWNAPSMKEIFFDAKAAC